MDDNGYKCCCLINARSSTCECCVERLAHGAVAVSVVLTDQRTELQGEVNELRQSLSATDKGRRDLVDGSKRLKDQLNQAVVSACSFRAACLLLKRCMSGCLLRHVYVFILFSSSSLTFSIF